MRDWCTAMVPERMHVGVSAVTSAPLRVARLSDSTPNPLSYASCTGGYANLTWCVADIEGDDRCSLPCQVKYGHNQTMSSSV